VDGCFHQPPAQIPGSALGDGPAHVDVAGLADPWHRPVSSGALVQLAVADEVDKFERAEAG
jgi:hypothetical protein